MKLGCSSLSYAKKIESCELDLFTWMGTCARDLRCDGIEIADIHIQSVDEDYIRQVRRSAVDLQLSIASLATVSDFGTDNRNDLEKQVEGIEQALQIAFALGAPMLRILAGAPDGEHEIQWRALVHAMQVLAVLAEREAVVIAIENSDTDGGFLSTAADVDRLMNEVNSDWLRFTLNTNGFSDGFDSIESSILYAVQTHAVIREVAPSGADILFDYPHFFNMLKDVNYRGYIHLLYEGEEPVDTALPRASAYIRSLLR